MLCPCAPRPLPPACPSEARPLPPLRFDPLGGPGGAQISASIAAIVCAASLAQRRTGLAPGPPSTFEVARAPPRSLPLPRVFLRPLAHRPRAHPVSRPLHPRATVPWDSRSSGLAPSPHLAARPWPPGSTCLPPLTPSGLPSPPPALLLQCLQSSPAAHQPLLPAHRALPNPHPTPPAILRMSCVYDTQLRFNHWTWCPFPDTLRVSVPNTPPHPHSTHTPKGVTYLLLRAAACPRAMGFTCNSKDALPPLSPSHCSKPTQSRLQGLGPSFQPNVFLEQTPQCSPA